MLCRNRLRPSPGRHGQAARKYGTIISYDLNYRRRCGKGSAEKTRAKEVNREFAPYVDVMLGNEEDFTAAFGFEVDGLDKNLSKLDVRNFKRMIQKAVTAFPNFKVVATTLRNARTASDQRLGRGVLFGTASCIEARRRARILRFWIASAAAIRSLPD